MLLQRDQRHQRAERQPPTVEHHRAAQKEGQSRQRVEHEIDQRPFPLARRMGADLKRGDRLRGPGETGDQMAGPAHRPAQNDALRRQSLLHGRGHVGHFRLLLIGQTLAPVGPASSVNDEWRKCGS